MKGFAVGAIVAAFPLAYILTSAVRRYALRVGILDVPKVRSSHTHVTPRGGGLGIVIPFVAGVGVLAYGGLLSWQLGIALCGGGLMVSGVGWIDDRQSLSAGVRGSIHTAAAIWALVWLGGLPQLRVGFASIPLGGLGWVLAGFGIVWLTNLYNFMDGIDGLAGMEAVSVGLAAGTLALAAGDHGLAAVSWLLASASAGFLVWNWPPAKIFMGDVSSGLLGFSFAVLAIASENSNALPLFTWLLLLGVFIVDATATLLLRIRRGERWYEPHRTHAYQLAVYAGHSHRQVTTVVLGVNVVLAALSSVTWMWPMLTPWVLMASTASLILVQRAAIIRFHHAVSPTTRPNGLGSVGAAKGH